ncbi:MAG: hypothetical protein F6K09_01360 [Merismopedia sp. SIO2A8]|nr:hypothetical protein [Merismopedia sp. SIO2A8]
MARQPLTVIAKIKPNQEEPLRTVLEAIASDLSNNPYLKIGQSLKTHFLRMALITDPDNGPRLLVTGTYDGRLSGYLDELARLGPEMDEIWNKCEGYQGRSSFPAFIEAQSLKAQSVFIAVRQETVANVRTRIAVREKLEQILDGNAIAPSLETDQSKPFLNRLFGLQRAPSVWRLVGLTGLRLWLFMGQVLSSIVDALRRGALALVLFLGRILGAPEQRRITGQYIGVDVDHARTRTLFRDELVEGTNHLHLLSTVRSGRLLRLRIVLFLADLTFRFLFPPGFLADIRTIHFAHWVLVDEGKRLLFVTHYDNSFDNYLGDFADRAETGLNSIWNNVEGYPIAGGADLVGFKQFFRNDQQLPSQVFYRAYPNVSVQNRIRDRDLTQTLADALDPQAVEEWLTLL